MKRRLKILLKDAYTSPGCQGFQPLRLFGKDRDVGSQRCAAFAVIGDTTNTTSRLQALTRSLGVDVVMSQALRQAVQRETPDAASEYADFADAGPQTIRGRERAIHVWTLTLGT